MMKLSEKYLHIYKWIPWLPLDEHLTKLREVTHATHAFFRLITNSSFFGLLRLFLMANKFLLFFGFRFGINIATAFVREVLFLMVQAIEDYAHVEDQGPENSVFAPLMMEVTVISFLCLMSISKIKLSTSMSIQKQGELSRSITIWLYCGIYTHCNFTFLVLASFSFTLICHKKNSLSIL